jgi:hypothetical protein
MTKIDYSKNPTHFQILYYILSGLKRFFQTIKCGVKKHEHKVAKLCFNYALVEASNKYGGAAVFRHGGR